MRANETFLQSLIYMDYEMRKDQKSGKPWRYTNVKKRYAKFEDARNGNRLTNCVSGVQMGLLMTGLPSAVTHWYGSQGKIVYTTNKGKTAVAEHFEIKKVNKTVSNLLKNNELCDGDILIYQGMNHTNCYIGGESSFDSGHAFCNGSGELAVFKKWIGSLTYKSTKVGTILRLKDRAHYRVQAGAYNSLAEYEKRAALIEQAGFGRPERKFEDGMYKVQVALCDGKTNAERIAAQVAAKEISVFVKEL